MAGRVHGGGIRLIRFAYGCGLQLYDRLPDAKPDALPLVLAAFEHLIGSPSRDYLSVRTMFLDQEIGGSPDVAIGHHSAFRSAVFLISGISLR